MIKMAETRKPYGVKSGAFRKKLNYCTGGNFPTHRCWRWYICMFELWKNCTENNKSHLQCTGADGAWAHLDSKTGSGKKKNSIRGLFCFLSMDSISHTACQYIGFKGSSGRRVWQWLRFAYPKRRAFARLPFSRTTWRVHPMSLLTTAELKNSEITVEARTCQINWFIEVLCNSRVAQVS